MELIHSIGQLQTVAKVILHAWLPLCFAITAVLLMVRSRKASQ